MYFVVSGLVKDTVKTITKVESSGIRAGVTTAHTLSHSHTHSSQAASQFIASPRGVRWDWGNMELFTVCLLASNSLAQHD